MKKMILGSMVLFFLALIAIGFRSTAAPGERVTICHLANDKYVQITVADDATFGGHIAHEGDIIPAPAEGCDHH